MTPMLDIVFIMLIFFIVASVFLDEQGMDFTEPPLDESAPPLSKSFLVSLDADDQAVVEGRRVSLTGVLPRIEALRAMQPDGSVVLAAAPQASVDAVVMLKDRFYQADIPISIRVEIP